MIPLSSTIAGCGAADRLPPVEIGAEIDGKRAATAVNLPSRPSYCRRVALRPLRPGEDMFDAHAWRTGEAEALNDRLDACGEAWDRMQRDYAGKVIEGGADD